MVGVAWAEPHLKSPKLFLWGDGIGLAAPQATMFDHGKGCLTSSKRFTWWNLTEIIRNTSVGYFAYLGGATGRCFSVPFHLGNNPVISHLPGLGQPTGPTYPSCKVGINLRVMVYNPNPQTRDDETVGPPGSVGKGMQWVVWVCHGKSMKPSKVGRTYKPKKVLLASERRKNRANPWESLFFWEMIQQNQGNRTVEICINKPCVIPQHLFELPAAWGFCESSDQGFGYWEGLPGLGPAVMPWVDGWRWMC